MGKWNSSGPIANSMLSEQFYSGTSCSGSPDVFEGPTNGKLKVNPQRYGAYKLVTR